MDQQDSHYSYYDYSLDIIDGMSDADSVSSSDDEDSHRQLCHLKRHLKAEDREVLFGQNMLPDEDSNLSFEREMENEARNHINGVHVTNDATTSSLQCADAPECDSEIMPVASTSKTKEQENDELFYDPDEDERDQKWADSQKVKYLPQVDEDLSILDTTISERERRQKLKEASRLRKPKSDATLNCPCCLALLCLDCQRHDIYKTQYRAMFVFNCQVDYNKKLLHPSKDKRRKQFSRSKKSVEQPNVGEDKGSNESKPSMDSSDLYYPVHCGTCNTEVAVYDTDEVYHFFSVIASH